jgi:hypothetical protein
MAEEGGYDLSAMAWYVTKDSLTDFQCCASFYGKPIRIPGITPEQPKICGIIGSVAVRIDDKLKGKIAELRYKDTDDYRITLDFSEQ